MSAGKLNGLTLFAIIYSIFFAFAGSTRAYLINTLGEQVVADMRTSVYDNLMRLSPAYYERIRTGEVLSRLTTDTTLVETVVTGSISFAIRSLVTIIGAIILMFFLNWKLTLMVVTVGPAIVIPAILVGKRIQRLSRDGQDKLAGASARAGESLSAIQTVQAFTREKFESEGFRSDIVAMLKIQKRRLFIRWFLTIFIIASFLISFTLIIRQGAQTVQTGGAASGEMIQFAILALFAVMQASMLTETWTNLLRAAGASERLSEILTESPEIAAPANPKIVDPATGNISFENVTFSYPTRLEEKALDDISFEIKPGETVALVGPSGAGKTTIYQLLLRFYDPQNGQILIDNVNLPDMAPKNLRHQLAIVQQNTPLFSGSAMENIRYGRIGATDEEVIEAAKAAYAHDFIMKLPKGYETDLGERATTLSGGQQQRIAIARAILRNAPILLLDEATSALDAESERAVQKAFETLSKGRTTLVIAHRLATVLKADRIIVLEDGKIVDTGTHKQLVKRDGLYARLADLQFDQDALN
ncbi:MAG: ATP-binding cassette domain-containing protein [Acidimicrobiales bacterium]|nr:MAG: ATP-binding cassette domain-containing protein [Acidimicrobiales bacterium]